MNNTTEISPKNLNPVFYSFLFHTNQSEIEANICYNPVLKGTFRYVNERIKDVEGSNDSNFNSTGPHFKMAKETKENFY